MRAGGTAKELHLLSITRFLDTENNISYRLSCLIDDVMREYRGYVISERSQIVHPNPQDWALTRRTEERYRHFPHREALCMRHFLALIIVLYFTHGAAEVSAAEIRAAGIRAAEVRSPKVTAAEIRSPEVLAAEIRVPTISVAEVRAARVRSPEIRAPDVPPRKIYFTGHESD